ncbi:MAG: tyrosine--tRNA ligase [Saprospiraceae bacterium]|nr:tyrosine--tRNA ligase [Saprospiraceae bacterium]MBP9209488.1 tyrosine--tRNA ligase [Saprospiraceae bacterium]
MEFVDQLRQRNILQDVTPGLEDYLSGGIRRAYIGFDPTARSLGLGNYVQIMLLDFFQRAGHQPVVLMGGATGRIGDPSGKDKERELRPVEELDANIKAQEQQLRQLLNFDEGPNRALWVNNLDFYQGMNVLDFLRDIGKHITVNYMMAKDSVRNRMESGISYTEFSYQLLQAYDFYCLYRQLDCRMQMGGSDQWGNITTGTEFIGKCIPGAKGFGLTTPLLTKADGKKFGKSEEGNVWLDPSMTSPYKFYQFWINTDDAYLPRLYRYFSLRPIEEIAAMEEKCADDPGSRKRLLAEEITLRVHGTKALDSARQVSELLFNKDCSSHYLLGLSDDALDQLGREIPHAVVPSDIFADGGKLVDVLTEFSGFLPSKSEARRAIQSNAVSVNKIKISQLDHGIQRGDFIHGKYLLLENGRKNKFMLLLS